MAIDGKLRVVILKEGDTWIAQCVEYDIGAQAKDLDELQSRFEAVFEAERAESVRVHGEEFAGIEPAPTLYAEMWEKSSGTFTPKNWNDVQSSPYQMAMVA